MDFDLDDVFKLATPKFVYIRDRYLGLLKYTFMFLIFLYVVVYDLMYNCSHLQGHPAGGYGTITMSHPSKECHDRTCINEYASIASLKYCEQAESAVEQGDSPKKGRLLLSKGKEPKLGDFITVPRTCRYLDNDRLTLEETPNQIFVPTRYVSYSQAMDKRCYDPLMKGLKGHTPRNLGDAEAFDCKNGWETQGTPKEFFVADIGDFTLEFQHSFMAPDIGMSGVSSDYKGFFAACNTNHPKDETKECVRAEVPNTLGAVAPEDEAHNVKPEELGINSLTGTPDGLDQIKFKDLLKLTPVARNFSWTEDIPDRKLPRQFGHAETSIRESGGMLMLSVDYDNTGTGRPGLPGLDLPAFFLGSIKPVTYTYRPYFIPTKSNKRVEVLQASDASATRTVNIWYGVTVQMSFDGRVVEFSFSQLLHGFTTGLVLLSSATTLVVCLALYVCKHKEKYLLQMYQYTEDMSEYKELPLSNLNFTSFTGKRLHDCRGKGGDTGELSNKEITDILVDYEIRLNRVDGRDPKLAFPDNSKSDAGVLQFRESHKTHLNQFLKFAKGEKPVGGME